MFEVFLFVLHIVCQWKQPLSCAAQPTDELDYLKCLQNWSDVIGTWELGVGDGVGFVLVVTLTSLEHPFLTLFPLLVCLE